MVSKQTAGVLGDSGQQADHLCVRRIVVSKQTTCVLGDIVLFSLFLSLEMYQLTNAHLWRQGQKEVATVHHILTQDTVDADVLKALK